MNKYISRWSVTEKSENYSTRATLPPSSETQGQIVGPKTKSKRAGKEFDEQKYERKIGAPSFVLLLVEFFPTPFDFVFGPTICPWVSEDALPRENAKLKMHLFVGHPTIRLPKRSHNPLLIPVFSQFLLWRIMLYIYRVLPNCLVCKPRNMTIQVVPSCAVFYYAVQI